MQKYNFSLKQTKNLITIWLFGKFLFGCLVSFRLVVWQVFIWLFGKYSFGYLAKLRLLSFTQYYSFKDNKYAKIYEKSPHRSVQQNRRGDFPSSILHHPSDITHQTSSFPLNRGTEGVSHFYPLNRGTEGVSPSFPLNRGTEGVSPSHPSGSQR